MTRGLRGPMGTVGGLTRTYGLHRHFEEGDRPRPSRKISRDELRRVSGYFRPYALHWLVIVGCIGAAAGLRVLPPFAVKVIIDRAIPNADANLLGLMSGAVVGLAVVAGLIGVIEQTLGARVGQSIVFDLRDQLFRHLQRMSLSFYTGTRSGEIVSRINNDVEAVRNVVQGTLVTIANNLATLTATTIAMLNMDWRLTLLAVAVVPAFYIPSRLVGGVRRRLSAQTQESHAALLAFLNERMHVGGSVLMTIFGQRQADAEAFSTASARVRDLHVRQTVVGRWLFMILSVFSAVGPALVYWYGGFQAISGALTTGALIAFAALLTQLYRPLVQLATVYVEIQASFAVFERIFDYLDLAPDVADRPAAIRLAETRGHIRFENVTFAYPPPPALLAAKEPPDKDDAPPVERFSLRDVSFDIPPGKRVALIGPSGAGKTTITYLVPRFYDPDAGRVMLDGYDLRELAQDDLRRHIGMVTQETFLFHSSVRENLLYARPDAAEADLVEACRAAHIHEFIDSLPDRYDTIVGERGFRLSGGEKQRLSIARALLKDPDILILDEATSNLDATSEHLI
ncbi:MAG: ABC transporter ATP-binding protein, partial [Planctomycetes bacterium]|nr:ABC transporter ATP-binding protein [Planctomycetota bacterium]